MSLIIYRLLKFENSSNEILDFRKIHAPRVINRININDRTCLGYKTNYIKNFLSLKKELKLSSKIENLLIECVSLIEEYNIYGEDLKKAIEFKLKKIEHLKINDKTNNSSFSIPIRFFYDEKSDIAKTISRINEEKINFEIEHKTQDSSVSIFTVNLNQLNRLQKDELRNTLTQIRNDSLNSLSLKQFLITEKKLQKLIQKIELKINKLIITDRFDLIKIISEKI